MILDFKKVRIPQSIHIDYSTNIHLLAAQDVMMGQMQIKSGPRC